MTAEPCRLLILDFEGVCSYSTIELVQRQAGQSGGAMDWSAVVRPEACEVVAAATAAGVTTAILSNEISPDWIDEVPLLGQVDHVVACSDNGILKPDRRAFQRCLLLTGHRAEETVVVDDHPDNITVAESLGMRTVPFDPGDPDQAWQRVMAEIDRR